MTRQEWLDEIAEQCAEEGILRMDGYDDCIIGVVQQFGRPLIFCYDVDRIMARLMKDGASEEEAAEFFSHNQLGAYVGPGTPCFMISMAPAVNEPSESNPKAPSSQPSS